MKEKQIIPHPERPKPMPEPEPKDRETKHGKHGEPLNVKHAGTIAAAVLLIVIISVASVFGGLSLYKNRYSAAKSARISSVTQNVYETAYTSAEAAYHVSNNIGITIGSIRTESALEVLNVSDVEYIASGSENGSLDIWQSIMKYGSYGVGFLVSGIYGAIETGDAVSSQLEKNSKVYSWLEITGNGVYTVDLTMAEFITDINRSYVKVRVPLPTLSSISIVNIDRLFYKDERWVNNGSIAEGEALARDQIEAGQLLIERSMTSNPSFYHSAKQAATTIITNLIKQLNPVIPDLTIEVEFME